MTMVEATINIVNVVASASSEHKIDLNALVRIFPSVEYRPKQFPGVIFRLKKPKTATLIFSSGKMVCTCARSENEARGALNNVINRLKEGGTINISKMTIKIVNIVASASLGGAIDLLQLYESARGMGERIIYEPEQFPGLKYRMNNPRAVILVFTSGKLVCTGTRKEETAYQAVNNLHQKLEEENLIYYA